MTTDNQGIKIALHHVTDLTAAKAVYTALLGFPPQTDTPYYIGFEANDQIIGLVPETNSQDKTPPIAFWQVANIDAKLAEVTTAGAIIKEAAHDVGGTRIVASFTDLDGNVLGVFQDK